MAILVKSDYRWSPDELHYYFGNRDSNVKEETWTGWKGTVEKVIDEINTLYGPGHSNKKLLTPMTPPSSLPENITASPEDQVELRYTSGGGDSGRIAKQKRKEWYCRCGDEKNIRHELLHVIGFKHEIFHSGYLPAWRVICGKSTELVGDEQGLQNQLRAMPIDKLNKDLIEDWKFASGNKVGFVFERTTYGYTKREQSTSVCSPAVDLKTVMMYKDTRDWLNQVYRNLKAYVASKTVSTAPVTSTSGLTSGQKGRYLAFINDVLNNVVKKEDKLNGFTANEKSLIAGY